MIGRLTYYAIVLGLILINQAYSHFEIFIYIDDTNKSKIFSNIDEFLEESGKVTPTAPEQRKSFDTKDLSPDTLTMKDIQRQVYYKA